MTESELLTIAKCFDHPERFILDHLQTLHPTEGIKAFPRKAYLPELIKFLCENRQLVIVKSRQMVATWTALSLLLWKAAYTGPGLFMVLSKNERTAKELLARLQFLIDHALGPVIPSIGKYTTEEIAFRDLESRIISLPATPDSPRMYSPKGVFWDEMAFTPYDEEIWTSLKPCLDSGGFFWGVSTSAGPLGLFAKMAKCPESYAMARFWLHYSRDPDKAAAWAAAAKIGLSEARWRREMEISFEASANAVYNQFSQNANVKPPRSAGTFPYLYRSIDWGFRTPVCLYIGMTGQDEVWIFDEIVGENLSLEGFANAIKKKDQELGLSEAGVQFSSCDPAGHSPGESGVSPIARFTAMGFKLRSRPSKISEGLDLVREAIGRAAGSGLLVCRNCARVLEDFGGYEMDDSGEIPLKDGVHDHTMDAVRYFFVNRFPAIKRALLHRPRAG